MQSKIKIVEVPLKDLRESKANPRTQFEKQQTDELAASIKAHGILQPLTIAKLAKGGGYEVLAGNRRLRAAKSAGLKSAPCIVSEQQDEAVKNAIQLVENMQRVDLTSYEQYVAVSNLCKKLSTKDIASVLGKKEKEIVALCSLDSLSEQAMGLFKSNVLPLAHALLLAKIEAQDQDAVLSQCIEDSSFDVSISRFRGMVLRRTNRLDLALFDLSDKVLYAEAGACNDCDYRTKGNEDLFGKEETIKCLNATCFDEKTSRAVEQRKEAARQRSWTVYDTARDLVTAKILPYETAWMEPSSRYYMGRSVLGGGKSLQELLPDDFPRVYCFDVMQRNELVYFERKLADKWLTENTDWFVKSKEKKDNEQQLLTAEKEEKRSDRKQARLIAEQFDTTYNKQHVLSSQKHQKFLKLCADIAAANTYRFPDKLPVSKSPLDRLGTLSWASKNNEVSLHIHTLLRDAALNPSHAYHKQVNEALRELGLPNYEKIRESVAASSDDSKTSTATKKSAVVKKSSKKKAKKK